MATNTLLPTDISYGVEAQVEVLIRMAPKDSYIIYMDQHGAIKGLQKSHRFPFKIEIGDRIEQDHIKGTNTARCWHEKKYLEAEGNPKTFGFPYSSKSLPLYENGEFLGAVSVVFPSDNNQFLESGISSLTDQVNVLNTLGKEMAEAGQDQAKSAEEIIGRVEDLQTHAKALVEINALVDEVASQTNLLGLNAAIEAARAGELGRGFGIVADEIRRLSHTVKDSSKQVNTKIGEILNDIRHIEQAIQTSAAGNEEISAQLQELSASVEQVHQSTAGLEKLINPS